MKNVRTITDLHPSEDTIEIRIPESNPLPNPWTKKQSQQRLSNIGLTSDSDIKYIRKVQYSYMGIDGYKHDVEEERSPSILKLCGLSCCPCCVPPLLDSEKKKQYFSGIKSLCFLLSFVQMVLLIVSLGLGGIDIQNNPSIGPPAQTLLLLGAKSLPLIQKGEVWRLVVPIFLHAGIIHLFFNLFAQLRFGLSVERKWGSALFALIYFGSGIGATIMSCLLSPQKISVGASGAIMGLMGANLAHILFSKSLYNTRANGIREWRLELASIVFVIVITMVFSAAPFIDAAAHFGGLLTGFLFGLVCFANALPLKSTQKTIVSVVGGILLVIFFILGLCLIFLVLQK
jgi:membrane associated rhomboid family serine protease